jgi:hypothetical protein
MITIEDIQDAISEATRAETKNMSKEQVIAPIENNDTALVNCDIFLKDLVSKLETRLNSMYNVSSNINDVERSIIAIDSGINDLEIILERIRFFVEIRKYLAARNDIFHLRD